MLLLFIDNQDNWPGIFIVLALLVLFMVAPEYNKVHRCMTPICPYFNQLNRLEQDIYCELHALPKDTYIKMSIHTGLDKNTIEGFYEALSYIMTEGQGHEESMIRNIGAGVWKKIHSSNINLEKFHIASNR